MNFVSHLHGGLDKKYGLQRKISFTLSAFLFPTCLRLFVFSQRTPNEFQAPKCIYVVAEDDLEFHGAFSLQDEPKNERPCWINDEDMSHLVFDKEIECWGDLASYSHVSSQKRTQMRFVFGTHTRDWDDTKVHWWDGI